MAQGTTSAIAALTRAEQLIRRDAEERARQAGYGLNAEAFVDGYRHDRTSTAIAYPGPDRMAYAAGWIARQLDDRRRSHEANLDGQHDELDNAEECGACTHVDELELRAIWGDR